MPSSEHTGGSGRRWVNVPQVIGAWIDGVMSTHAATMKIVGIVMEDTDDFHELPEHEQNLQNYRNHNESRLQAAVLDPILGQAESLAGDSPESRRDYLNSVLRQLPQSPAILELTLDSQGRSWGDLVRESPAPKAHLDPELLAAWTTADKLFDRFLDQMSEIARERAAKFKVACQTTDPKVKLEAIVGHALFEAESSLLNCTLGKCFTVCEAGV